MVLSFGSLLRKLCEGLTVIFKMNLEVLVSYEKNLFNQKFKIFFLKIPFCCGQTHFAVKLRRRNIIIFGFYDLENLRLVYFQL